MRRSIKIACLLIIFALTRYEAHAAEAVGTGDGLIHIIPALSAPSVKNGAVLTIQAVVKASSGVARVEAVIEGVEIIQLHPTSINTSGVNVGATMGLYQADWKAHGLKEQVYHVAVRVTDLSGHIYTDRSLKFSDPIAGNTTGGNLKDPAAGMRRMGMASGLGEDYLTCAVVDTVNGYAYFGTNTSPGNVIKVALAGSSAPIRIGAVVLNNGEDYLVSAVIDTVNGYAYFGTTNRTIVKVGLGNGATAPIRAGALTLNDGETGLFSAVIDSTNGYAYFGTNTSPGIVVKVALGNEASPPTRVSVATLNSGENSLRSAVIDPAKGYAYFGTDTSPGIVVKVSLGDGLNPPARVSAVTLASNENQLRSAVIDTARGFAYFGTFYPDSPAAIVVKVALGDGDSSPTRVSALSLTDEGDFCGAVINATGSYAFFCNGGAVVKLALGSGTSAPTRVGTVTYYSGEDLLCCGVIDSVNGYAYFGTNSRPGMVNKVSLGVGAGAPARSGSVILCGAESAFYSAVVDDVNGYAYFGSHTAGYGTVVKVALGSGATPPARVGAVTLNYREDYLASAVIDTAHGYAYFGRDDADGKVIKIALGSGASPPTRVGAVTLNVGENQLRSAVIDVTNGYAYFGTHCYPGQVIKISLGSGSNPPTRVGAVTLESDESNLCSAVIDSANGYAYFATEVGKVVKVALGVGSNPPIRVGAATLGTDEYFPCAAVIDTANGYAYFGAGTNPGKVVKVALGSGTNPPMRVGAVTLNNGEYQPKSAVIDVPNGYAYFGTGTNPGKVVKVALGSGSSAPTRIGALTLDAELDLTSAVIDNAKEYAYFGSWYYPGHVNKVALSSRNFIHANLIQMPESGIVNDIRLYTHTISGHLRLAIYDDTSSHNLLWQSPSFSNVGGWNVVPVSPHITLTTGNYWLAWQTDTTSDIASYMVGSSGCGLYIQQAYGSFPVMIPAQVQTTADLYSEYITYTTDSIWVNFNYLGIENGTQAMPYNTLIEGLLGVNSGGTIHISGSSATSERIQQPVRLESWGGTATIGR